MNQRRELVFADRFHRLDWGIQIERIKEAVKRYHTAAVFVDSTGAGEPVYEVLRTKGVCAMAYPLTVASKAALINNLAMLFEQNLITIPRYELWPEGIDELEAFEYSVTDLGNVRTGAPSGLHDDTVIALGLAAWRLQQSLCIVPQVW